MFIFGSFYSEYAAVAAALAASVAVMGFVLQAIPVLKKDDEARIRQSTAVGGLVGLVIGIVVIVIEAAF